MAFRQLQTAQSEVASLKGELQKATASSSAQHTGVQRQLEAASAEVASLKVVLLHLRAGSHFCVRPPKDTP